MSSQLHKVNAFYFERTEELNSRLNVLVESVVEEYGTKGGATPVIHHKRKQSLAAEMVSRIQRVVTHKETTAPQQQQQRQVHVPHDSSYDDDNMLTDPGLEFGDEYTNELKASDSIQRAMTDMYRTAKLLHNFAIMNYTGFVKIVKKHDKTFKEYKGKFKNFTVETEVCNGGKDVATLEERMVRGLARGRSRGIVVAVADLMCRLCRNACMQTGSAKEISWKDEHSSCPSVVMDFRWIGLNCGKWL
jgi:hypothetical protein